MNNRIKEVREYFKLSQGAFGQRIGLAKSGISRFEHGRNGTTDQTINSICREFGVNELWLRHGDEGGPMFKELSRKDAIAAYMGKLLSGERSELEEKLIDIMAAPDVEQWDKLLELIRPLAKNISEIEKPPDA